MSFLYVCLFSNGHLAHAMNTLMPAPVAKPNTGKQAVAARLRAGAPLSSSRVHACESSLAGLPGLYSGRFLFCRQHDSEIPIAIQRNRGGERGLDTAWMGAGCILRN